VEEENAALTGFINPATIIYSGSMENLVSAIRYALSKAATPQPALPDHSTKNLVRLPGPEIPSANDKTIAADVRHLTEVIGHPGRFVNGVFEISVGRSGVLEQGTSVPGGMGVSSWVAFAGIHGDSRITGDIAMTETEVDRVLRVMRDNKIDVVSIHNHLLKEQPRVFFVRFWGAGQAEDLAEVMHDVLDIVQGPIDNMPHAEPELERKSIIGYRGW
jgi:hypothetical protein